MPNRRIPNSFTTHPYPALVIHHPRKGEINLRIDLQRIPDVARCRCIAETDRLGHEQFFLLADGAKVSLAPFILGLPKGEHIWHINGDRQDFRESNLTTSNEFFVDTSGLTRMVVESKHGKFWPIVDAEDVPLLSQHRWVATKKKAGRRSDGQTIHIADHVYFYTSVRQSDGKYKLVALHRLLMGNPQGKIVDHVEPSQTIDNRKINLRVVTHKENNQNSRKTTKRTHSRFKGVSFDSSKGVWFAQSSVNNRTLRINRFFATPQGEIEAALAYDAFAEKHFTCPLLNREMFPELKAATVTAQASTSSVFKGVYRDRQVGKWHAHIRINRWFKYLDHFPTELEAAIAYNTAATYQNENHGGRFLLNMIPAEEMAA